VVSHEVQLIENGGSERESFANLEVDNGLTLSRKTDKTFTFLGESDY